MNKKILREQVLSKRDSLLQDEVEKNSRAIFKSFIQSSFYKDTLSLFAYLSFRNEVSTRTIIEKSLNDSKSIGLPAIQADGKMLPLVFLNWNDLKPDKYGIPAPSKSKAFAFSEKTVILVPGVVFDQKGHRIGFGKGYYDRFLNNHPKALKVALAHDFQIVDTVPNEAHDIPMDLIITEKKIINCRGF